MTESTYDGLPDFCYASLGLDEHGNEYPNQPEKQSIIKIIRGERGYHRTGIFGGEEQADIMNAALGVKPNQSEAMLAGSMFGWYVPGANPAKYDEEGFPI